MGRLNSPQVENVIGLANSCQSAFDFDGLHTPAFNIDPYRLPNGAVDLDAASLALLRQASLSPPVIVLTQEPYGDSGSPNDPADVYFSGQPGREGVSIISTHLWSSLPALRPLQPYLLFEFATVILTACADLDFHNESRACPLDYCDDPTAIDSSLRNATLCNECRSRLPAAIRNGRLTLAEAAAAVRLLNRARGVRQVFVAMPFAKAYAPTFTRGIQPALANSGWQVTRVDRSTWPRIITDAIILGILSADLVIGEVSSANPNVYYEIGIADAIHADLILVARKGTRLPFDLSHRRTIFYIPKRLDKLRSEIAQMAGPGTL